MAGRHDEALHRRLRWPVVFLVVILIYGVAGYMLMDWSFVDALYMTLLALTTVGFREVRPLDDAGKIFTVSIMVLGVTLLLVTLTLVAVWVAEGVLTEHRRWRRMQRRIDRLRNHFIVCAFGRVGRTAAREFRAEGVPFVVIDPDESSRSGCLRRT